MGNISWFRYGVRNRSPGAGLDWKQSDPVDQAAAAEAENTKIKAKAQAEANNELSASITDELIKMKEAEAHYKNGWITVQGADAVIADK